MKNNENRIGKCCREIFEGTEKKRLMKSRF